MKRFGFSWLGSAWLLLFFCQFGKADDVPGSDAAVAWARQFLQTETATVQHYDTYWNPDGSPHAELFTCRAGSGTNQQELTLALSPGTSQRQVLFYYFAEPFDRQFRPTGKAIADSRVIVSPTGLLLRSGATTRRIPQPGGADEALLLSPQPGKADQARLQPVAESLPTGAGVTVGPADGPGPLDGDVDEMIIPGVPNYLWYLNCAVASESMILGYWNDHGCASLVPGNNSTQGCYYAITEELMWLRDDRIKRYGAARELGYSWQFNQTALPNKEWATYVSAVQAATGPLSVSWNGAPYGAHSTVGVGYKEADGNRFLILHDTWVATPAYVNYDVYATSIVTIAVTTLGASTNAAPCTNAIPTLASGTVLAPTNFIFSPSLSFAAYAYHCFEAGDFNRDGLTDLLVGNFRNNVASAVRLSLYTNGNNRFTRDPSFAPTLDWYECVHVVRTCDFDRDGDLDVAVSGYWMPARVYVNTGSALTNQAIALGNEYSTFGYNDLAWGDIDGDGDSDLVTCIANPYSTLEGKMKVYRWQDGIFQLAASVGLSSHWYQAVKFCDLNNDQRPEIVCANRYGSVLAFLNTAGQFTNAPFFLPTQGHGAMTFDVADVDGDGFVEIVTVDDGKIVIFDNGPNGLSTSPQYLNTSLPMFAKDVKLADLNRDGFPELLVANYNTRSAIFLNRGGVFETKPIWLSPRADPGVRIHVYESSDPNQTIVGFAKARGATAEFYRVTNVPVFAGISADAGTPTLNLENLLPGEDYAIERAARLSPPAWTEVLQFQSAGSKTNWTDLNSRTNAQGFYRVRYLE